MEKQYFYKEMFFSKRSKYFYIRFMYASTIEFCVIFLYVVLSLNLMRNIKTIYTHLFLLKCDNNTC